MENETLKWDTTIALAEWANFKFIETMIPKQLSSKCVMLNCGWVQELPRFRII